MVVAIVPKGGVEISRCQLAVEILVRATEFEDGVDRNIRR